MGGSALAIVVRKTPGTPLMSAPTNLYKTKPLVLEHVRTNVRNKCLIATMMWILFQKDPPRLRD